MTCTTHHHACECLITAEMQAELARLRGEVEELVERAGEMAQRLAWARVDLIDLRAKLETATDENERLRELVTATKAAALRGMDAVTAVSSGQLREAHRLASMSSPDALESERAMNAALTAENDNLRAKLEAAERDAKKLLDETLAATEAGR